MKAIRTRVRTVALTGGLVAIFASTGFAQRAALASLSGPVAVAGTFPNFFAAYDLPVLNTPGIEFPSTRAFLSIDPVNRLAFEQMKDQPSGACDNRGAQTILLVKYDLDTQRPIGLHCPEYYAFPDGGASGDVGSFVNWQVFDPTSRLILSPYLDTQGVSHVEAISEDSLEVVGDLCVGPGAVATSHPCQSPPAPSSDPLGQPYQYVHGISWYRPTDDVIALTDEFSSNALGGFDQANEVGVAVADYHISTGSTGVNFALRWVTHIPPTTCVHAIGLNNINAEHWFQQAAYMGENSADPALFVPCVTLQPSDTLSTNHGFPHVLKVPLDGTCMCPTADPPKQIFDTTPPSQAGGFLFDPVGERGYLLPVNGLNDFGATVVVYDGGSAGSIVGRFSVGSEKDTNGAGFMFNLDPTSGRFYAEDPKHGLRVVDGRRTPLNSGSFFPIAAVDGSSENESSLVIAPPGDGAPYARVLMSLGTGQTRMTSFTVVGDGLPVTHDPPPTSIDGNTFNGQIPLNAVVSASYRTHAAGFGVHSDLIGGYAGAWYNNNPVSAELGAEFPNGRSSLDLAMGAVENTSVDDGNSTAASSAMADVNGSGAVFVRSCSDRYSPQSCVPPSCPVVYSGNELDGCAQLYRAVFSGQAQPGTSSGQAWPFPTAQCGAPGPTAQQEWDGMYRTPDHSTDPTATPAPQQEVLGSAVRGVSPPVTSGYATGARAAVVCTGPVSAHGRLSCAGAGGSTSSDLSASQCDAAPTVTMDTAQTDTTVTPPSSPSAAASSAATAVASGIHIELPDGAMIDIGQIRQSATAEAAGRQGTARTHRVVEIDDVIVRNVDGTEYELCAGPCMGPGNQKSLQSLLDTLNSLDPSHLFVSFPSPDEPFDIEADGVSPKGSPGGYQAIIEANLVEREGDQQFNGMEGFGGAEATILPAMRVVIVDPGSSQISREVIDFAGVEADARLGLDVTPPDSGTDGNTTTDVIQQLIEAGVPPVANWTPGTPAFPGQLQAPTASTRGGLFGVLERTLDGLKALFRSPFAGIQMAAFLVMLGLPLLLARRRWAWRR